MFLHYGYCVKIKIMENVIAHSEIIITDAETVVYITVLSTSKLTYSFVLITEYNI
jgi:hypothetical protein